MTLSKYFKALTLAAAMMIPGASIASQKPSAPGSAPDTAKTAPAQNERRSKQHIEMVQKLDWGFHRQDVDMFSAGLDILCALYPEIDPVVDDVAQKIITGHYKNVPKNNTGYHLRRGALMALDSGFAENDLVKVYMGLQGLAIVYPDVRQAILQYNPEIMKSDLKSLRTPRGLSL